MKKVKLDPNQVSVDWEYNTGNMSIIITLGDYNLRDAGKEDFHTQSTKEVTWRQIHERVANAIREKFK